MSKWTDLEQIQLRFAEIADLVEVIRNGYEADHCRRIEGALSILIAMMEQNMEALDVWMMNTDKESKNEEKAA